MPCPTAVPWTSTLLWFASLVYRRVNTPERAAHHFEASGFLGKWVRTLSRIQARLQSNDLGPRSDVADCCITLYHKCP